MFQHVRLQYPPTTSLLFSGITTISHKIVGIKTFTEYMRQLVKNNNQKNK